MRSTFDNRSNSFVIADDGATLATIGSDAADAFERHMSRCVPPWRLYSDYDRDVAEHDACARWLAGDKA